MIKQIESFKFNAGGDIFIDVGGNVGMWTKELYPFYNKIYFIEPSSAALTEAKQAISDTDNKVVYLKKICSATSNEKKSIYSPLDHSGCLSVYGKELYESSYGIQMSEEDIDTMTIDDLTNEIELGSKILIKIDTEGHDLDVLLGAEKFIRKFKPNIALEVHFHMHFDQNKYDKVFALLKELNYNIVENKFSTYSGTHLVDKKHTADQMYNLHYQMFMTVE